MFRRKIKVQSTLSLITVINRFKRYRGEKSMILLSTKNVQQRNIPISLVALKLENI